MFYGKRSVFDIATESLWKISFRAEIARILTKHSLPLDSLGGTYHVVLKFILVRCFGDDAMKHS
jgi:hypothetical protein